MVNRVFLVTLLLIVACSINDARLFPKDNNNDTAVENIPITPQEYRLIAGGDNSCYLYEEGRVKCWGRHNLDNLNRYRITSLALGDQYACGVDQQSSPFCIIKGDNQDVNINSEIFGKSYTILASGRQHLCGITQDKELSCWGDNTYGQAKIPSNIAGREFIFVAAGYDHNCAISSNGEPFCWGRNDQGQATISSRIANKGLTNLSLGETHSCGLTNTKEIYCWGGIQFEARNTSYLSFTSGKDFVCAINYKNDIKCWFKDNNELFTTVPENNFKKNYVQIAAGHQHLCASTSTKKTACWGNNDFKQLEAGTLP